MPETKRKREDRFAKDENERRAERLRKLQLKKIFGERAYAYRYAYAD